MKLEGLKINVLGDSITQGVGASSPDKMFTEVLARKTGATVRNYGLSASRIANQCIERPHIIPHIPSYIDRADSMDRDADVVLVFGGTNDFGHGDAPFGEFLSEDDHTFCGAMNVLIKKLVRLFPDAEIVIMTPLHRLSENVTTNELGLPCRVLKEYVDMEKKYAEYYALPVLDLWGMSGIQPADDVLRERFLPDTLHPNDRGHERIADRIISLLKAL
ncbi:MAG: SGNH/GDSL hydrolase family protein [Clostridia bacterium]|nr:SGNH/GDSL hydrolase family protein [Clostridia bacterium]MBR5006019.1 SGNH/GDSL hydrolase family protein [Clostridia bacterium]